MTFSLKLTKLIATLNFPQYSLPYWLGNKFRGGFGSVLLKAVCGYLKPECKNCVSRDDCLYHALYIRDRQKRGKSQPVRPIIFIPPFFGKKIEGKGEIKVEINVFGDYIKYLPHIVYGLRFLGKVGLNSASKYEVIKITDFFSGREIYDGEGVKAEEIRTIDLGNHNFEKHYKFISNNTTKINFQTPIEAKTPINLPYLIHMIRRRLILYVNEYGNGDVPDFICEAEILESNWKNHKLFHHSKRMGARVFHGVTGSAKYKILNADENAFRFLTMGEFIGAGAKSSFGMGFFKFEPI